MQQRTPSEIESESMRIIDSEAAGHHFSKQEWPVVRRMIHATADFDFIQTIRFHPQALKNALAALGRGCPIYADTGMLTSAIQKKAHDRFGCSITCLIGDADIAHASAQSGETRSVLAMRKAAPLLKAGIIAIGNAPTALHEAINLYESGILKPALIIGLPVGFVEARESKDRLFQSGITSITNLDRKGGTPATAAALNALLCLAESERPS
ncbi:MAG: precorrin-8X methylmutase [Deltaproteobacteria bacterium]|nr:precorrin-8X methylmutase [Deltaproteobacteria bacterium]